MMDNELKTFIQNSSLSYEDKVLWTKAFEKLTKNQIKQISEHINNDEAELKALTEEIRKQLKETKQ